MSILEEFAYGSVNPNELGRKRSKEFDKAAKALLEAEDRLLASLNDSEKELFKEFAAAQMNLGSMTEVQKFVQGYILGSAMTFEVMSELDEVTL